ncbi:hypothetical protein pb186bvf_014009 [Paramecium bursaria]
MRWIKFYLIKKLSLIENYHSNTIDLNQFTFFFYLLKNMGPSLSIQNSQRTYSQLAYKLFYNHLFINNLCYKYIFMSQSVKRVDEVPLFFSISSCQISSPIPQIIQKYPKSLYTDKMFEVIKLLKTVLIYGPFNYPNIVI